MDPVAQRLSSSIADAPGEPVADVIVNDLWLAVVDGSLEGGERLPTARELAVSLRVSPRIVERAYEELSRRGVLATRAGEGTFVSLDPPSEAECNRRRKLAELCRETLERARDLGFAPEEVIEMIAEHRADRSTPIPEHRA